MDAKFPAELSACLVYLLRCAVNDTAPDADRIAGVNCDELLEAADYHGISAACAYALEKAGVKQNGFTERLAVSQRNAALFDFERGRILAALEQNKIKYMPLKGIIIKDFYPAYGIRQMADNDILFDKSRAGDVREIMTSFGYTVKAYDSYNVDSYIKEPVLNFEMHRTLESPVGNKKIFDYYSDLSGRLIKDDNSAFGYRFSDSDFYLYIIAHEYKHYYGYGTGLRTLADTYLCLKNLDIDFDYVEKEAEKTGIAGFEKSLRSLSLAVFNGESLDSRQKEMLDYIINCGTYGNGDNYIKNRIDKKGEGAAAAFRYILSRIFIPMRVVELEFPFFYRHKPLLVFLPFYRFFKSLKKNRKKLFYEIFLIKRKK